MTTGRKTGKRIGELLVERGAITPAQLEEALAIHRQSNEFLGATLVRRGYITESTLFDVIAEQFGMPRAHFDSQTIDWELAAQFPPTLLLDHRCFPVGRDEQSLTVAIGDPLDVWIVSALEHEARGRKLTLMLASPREIAVVARELYRRTLQRVERSVNERTDRG